MPWLLSADDEIKVMVPHVFFSTAQRIRLGAAFALTIMLPGCVAIPASGPTGGEIRSQLKADTSHLGIALVPITSATDLPKPAVPAPVFAPDRSEEHTSEL